MWFQLTHGTTCQPYECVCMIGGNKGCYICIYIFLNVSRDPSRFGLGVFYKSIQVDNTWHAPILKSLMETFNTANNTLVDL